MNYDNRPYTLDNMSGQELELWYTLAQEFQDGRYIKRINEERNRREKYEY